MQQLGVWLRRHGSTLQHVHLDLTRLLERNQSTDIVPDDILWQELASGFESCRALYTLNLVGWRGSVVLPNLRQSSQLTQMHLQHAHISSSGIQQFLINLPVQLQVLDLSSTLIPGPQNRVGQLVSRLSHLTSLDLRSTSMHASHLAFLPKLPSLQQLSLSHCRSPSNLKALAKLPCNFLETTICADQDLQEFLTWGAGQEGMKCLGRITGLDCSLANGLGAGATTAWSHALLPCVVTAATNLMLLWLKGECACIQDLRLLKGVPKLTRLSFEYTGPPDADVVSPLAALPSLELLIVTGLSAGQVDAVRAARPSLHLLIL